MARRRRLSQQECQWVNAAITELCRQLSLNPGDEEYRSVSWLAFQSFFQSYFPVWEPAFWPEAYRRMEDAIRLEKQIRSFRLYRSTSLDLPLLQDGRETFLDRLRSQTGDFTNWVAFYDFLERLPEEPHQLAWRLIQKDTLEEARSCLGWTSSQLCEVMERLREEVALYEAS